jgi:hypothetical protein
LLTEYLPIAILFVLASGLAVLVVVAGRFSGLRRPAGRGAFPMSHLYDNIIKEVTVLRERWEIEICS